MIILRISLNRNTYGKKVQCFENVVTEILNRQCTSGQDTHPQMSKARGRLQTIARYLKVMLVVSKSLQEFSLLKLVETLGSRVHSACDGSSAMFSGDTCGGKITSR